MPIDLVIDERDTKPDLGDNNNSSSNGSGGPPGIGLGGGGGSSSNGGIGGLRGNGGGSSDHGHHSDSASTPDHQVCYSVSQLEIFYYYSYPSTLWSNKTKYIQHLLPFQS